MKVVAPIVALLLVGCGRSEAVSFANASITLPEDSVRLPPGPHLDLVTANCTGCHSAEMILNQPRLDRKTWEAEVTKMIKVYKAPVAETDMPAIVDYLVATNDALTGQQKAGTSTGDVPARASR